MGSEKVLLEYCLKSGRYLKVWVYQFDSVTGEMQNSYVNAGISGSYQSKEQMEDSFKVLVSDLIQELSVNDYGQRKGDVFECFVAYYEPGDMEVFGEGFERFYLLKQNGVYTSPDLSKFKMDLPRRIPYKLQATWIRSVVYDTSLSSTSIADSTIGNELIVKLFSGHYRVEVPKEQAIGAGKNYNVRISAFIDGQFVIYENGIRVDENRPKLDLDFYPNSNPSIKVSLKVRGGEIGRTYSLFTSRNQPQWEDTGLRYVVTPYSQNTIFTMEPCEGAIYQLRSVETTPVY
jgi:hypothetical protein